MFKLIIEKEQIIKQELNKVYFSYKKEKNISFIIKTETDFNFDFLINEKIIKEIKENKLSLIESKIIILDKEIKLILCDIHEEKILENKTGKFFNKLILEGILNG